MIGSDTPCAACTMVRSELQLCSSPMSPSGVVPDCVVSSVSDPVGQRAVLLDLLRHARLLDEALNRSHFLDILQINDKQRSVTQPLPKLSISYFLSLPSTQNMPL